MDIYCNCYWKYHRISDSQKGEDALRNLNRWVKNNPTASPGDRAAVENIIQDINDALGYTQRPNPMNHKF